MKFMKRIFAAFLCLIVLPFVAGSGCSTIKSWFPDKEKDYQFRTEIPELVLPKELAIQKVERPVRNPKVDLRHVDTNQVVDDVDKITQVERVATADAVVLRINEPVGKAWRIVGKAMARQSIEIVARDRSLASYIVQYDPEEQRVTDDSFWDEILFVFGLYGSNEKEYRIRLIEYEQFTDIMVKDETNKAVSSGDGLTLLLTIQQAIEDDLADQ
ncbi:MAG: outer membrane protein assembly factor BamC [Gammaproteobacteria bacterium]|nr:outer membrane protein assembly factor BamC [Gammaproteobacteria bacterium]